MCNGSSSRVSQGGSIAVLRPTSHLARTHPEQEMVLFFTNPLSKCGTNVECQGLNDVFQQDSHRLVIHCDGDLCSSQHQSASDALYTFEIDSPQRGFMQLPEKLHLGVGDKGIIGRRISVMTRSTQHPLTLAEGILGWN
ncbi:hypothetical protein BKA58DRAFT_96088 [Alternaria rosae]|uniref:uncharacterized protein n=1 Tax=Alternaria rosae TaxID=1187941 RepID=UPI001E8D6C60|nr:uncharacterized protein BKA58DRAFT_96088 [Alternaria rosae]KAH6878449.1 hypothetical protein BKA58DRAFT_96088 [Alternaria rosae]